MREVRVTVPPDEQPAVVSVLTTHEIHYELQGSSTPENEPIVSILCYLPAASTQFILDEIQEAVTDADALTIVIKETSTVIGKEHTHQRIKAEQAKNKVARDELLQRAEGLQPEVRSYLLLSMLSVFIAIFGLLLESIPVIIGGVVLAPLLGPALAAGVGTVTDDQRLFERGIYLQTVGVGTVVIAGAAFAAVLRLFTPMTPDQVLDISLVSQNVSPNILALGLAFGSGIAGAYSLSFKSPSALVGVAMAAAILPPLGVASIGIAWGMPTVAFGAFVAAVLSLLVINMIAIPVFWLRGYSPRTSNTGLWRDVPRKQLLTRWSRQAWFQRVAMMTALILIVSLFVGFVTLGQWENSQVEQDIRADIEELHESPQYQALDIVDIDISYDQSLPVPNIDHVTITVSYTPQTDEAIANDFLIRVSAFIEHHYDIGVTMSEQRTIGD